MNLVLKRLLQANIASDFGNKNESEFSPLAKDPIVNEVKKEILLEC